VILAVVAALVGVLAFPLGLSLVGLAPLVGVLLILGVGYVVLRDRAVVRGSERKASNERDGLVDLVGGREARERERRFDREAHP
jgi:hypothetical protein